MGRIRRSMPGCVLGAEWSLPNATLWQLARQVTEAVEIATEAEILALAAAISKVLDRQQRALERVEDLKFRRRRVKREEPQEAVDDVSDSSAGF